jgi:microcystin-dependent protein
MTSAGGIQRPVIPPRSSAQLAESMVQDINPSAVLRRWGIITAVNSNGSVDVNVAGQTIPAVKRLASYNPTKDERVTIDVVGTDMVVVGATAPSPKNQNQRTATVTAIHATNGTLTIKFDDNTTLAGVTRVATYNPTINDVVQVVMTGSGGSYIVTGPVMGNTQPYLRRPTGDIEMSIRKTPKPGTIFLDGSIVNRADYPNLFAWVQAQGLLTTAQAPNNLFSAGNGTTTFGLPDLKGRVPVGVGTLTIPGGVTDTYALGDKQGTNRISVATTNLPNHTHTVSDHPAHSHTLSGTATSAGTHQHPRNGGNFYTNTTGSHDGHVNGTTVMQGYAVTNDPDWTKIAGWTSRGDHNHTVDPGDPNGAHTHPVSGSAANNSAQTHTVQLSGGSATPAAIDTRPPSFAVNYLIWI